jgi:hypothetical protein
MAVTVAMSYCTALLFGFAQEQANSIGTCVSETSYVAKMV